MKLPKLGFLYMDYVLQFFHASNFKGWPDKIESVVYHWGNDKDRFIKEVKQKNIDILIGNIPATAYETFREISDALPDVRFVPSLETQFSNKSKENVTLFCNKHNLSHPHTEIIYDRDKALDYLAKCDYPKIIKRSYGPSNYGGYYVHKVDDAKEAIDLMKTKKYQPAYIQNCVPLTADIRVMLIGHRPVCAFWRVAGKDQWITNTSQGGHMSYEGVDMGALELAVEASKAAKAEYWACDIAEHEGKYYILECATAFAAFPYIRDWIGQYLMWDFSDGRFPMPSIPLYSWEELGKLSSNFLRTMRHIEFSKYVPSADGATYMTEPADPFSMELTELTGVNDIPNNPNLETYLVQNEAQLPQLILDESKQGDIPSEEPVDQTFYLKQATLTDLMGLYGMEEAMAEELYGFVRENDVESLDDLKALDWFDTTLQENWKDQVQLKLDLNSVTAEELLKVRHIGKTLADAIVSWRESEGRFESVEDLLSVEGIGEKRFERIQHCFSVES